MKICFIGDATSIHVSRIVSYYERQNDQVLLLSTGLTQASIPDVNTVHLIAHNKPALLNAEKRGVGSNALASCKALIPRALRGLIRRLVRDVKVVFSHKLCRKEILRFEPDVVFCNRSFPEGVLASRCGVGPLLLRTAGPDISKRPKYPIYRQLIRNALRSANVVLTQSLWEKDLLRRLCGKDLRVEVNNIGIDTNTFRPAVTKDTLRDKYGLAHDAFVVVTNRYLNGHYNGWLVMDAIESILDACPDLVLFYTSPLKLDVSTRERVDSITRRFSRVRFVEGPVAQSEIADILRCGDVYVSFSSYDGIPNSVLEAMACGIVPIVADLPQLHEWVEHQIDGYVVPQKESKSLATVISHLYNHRDMLPTMSARCVERIRTRASYEICSKQTRDLIHAIITRESCLARDYCP